ncbi:apolipoprotein N-acyltransferase, partial [bacterium]
MSYILCILSSFSLILSFPKANLSILAFFALIPWIYVITNEAALKKVFLKSFIVGIITNLGIMYWLIPMFRTGGLPVVLGIFFWFLLCIYLGTYFAVWGLLVYRLKHISHSLYFVLYCSALWIVLEFIRNYLFTGFPWMLFGYSQWHNTTLIQICEYTGIYGISFLLVFINTALFSCIKYFKTSKKLQSSVLTALFLIIITTFTFGFLKLNNAQDVLSNSKKYSFTVLQGNIDQYKKFDVNYVEFIKKTYEQLVKKSSVYAHDVIIWPETSLPGLYNRDKYLTDWVKKLVQESNTKHIIGAFIADEGKFYNTAVFFDEDSTELDKYYKIHLVPFGEIFPLKDIIK